MDFVTGLPNSAGNSVVLTVIDCFRKFTCFLPLPKLPSSKETTELLVKEVFRVFGMPLDVVSDRGSQLTTAVWKAFCASTGVTVSLTSGYHPQSNGQTERANQVLETSLCCMVSSNPSTRSTLMPWVEYTRNTLTMSATGMSSFQCVFGYQPPLFPSQEKEISVPSVQAQARHKTVPGRLS